MNQHHDAWHVLFFNPFFWEQTGKKGLDLRRVCKNFRKEIPERLAIEAAFCDVLIRKVEVYRLLPLSVNDVVRLRSPLLFVDAFRLAVKKSGNFEFCIAVVRERGWALWNTVGVIRSQYRDKLVEDLVAGGVTWPVAGDLFESAVRRYVESAVVWHFDSPIHLPDNTLEFNMLLLSLRNAVGFWYKGINKDVRSVCSGISHARRSHALGNPICCMHHQHIAAGKFVFGVVKFLM